MVEAARELNCHLSISSRNLRMNTKSNVGIFISENQSLSLFSLASGIKDVAIEDEYAMNIVNQCLGELNYD
jgi:DNA-binding LacI/PurR family transcriptional regulator